VPLDVSQFAGVLFEMRAPDADPLGRAVRQIDLQPAVDRQREFVLADLVAFGQVRIEVALAGELVEGGDLAVQRQPDHQAELDSLLVNDRQHARHRQADRADHGVGLGRGAVHYGTTAEHLRFGEQLGVDFQADHGLVGNHWRSPVETVRRVTR